MISVNKEIKLKRKRIWRSIVTTLAAIVVFVTTYALIIPAITWERTLICPLEEHVHTDFCYSSKGELKCGKKEHKHTDACFDAPEAIASPYICGKSEHTHTEECYFSDGTLKCTVQEHIHTEACERLALLKLALPSSATPLSFYDSDPDTSSLAASFITCGPGSASFSAAAQNDGKVLVDKSVFVFNPQNDKFDVVLSALGQSYVKTESVQEMVHPDVVFVVDISTSMARSQAGTSGKSRLYAVTVALNNGISQLLKQDPQTRIGIVSFSNYAWDGYRDTSDNYHRNGDAPKYFYLPLDYYEYKGDNYNYVLIDNEGYGDSYVNGNNTAHVSFNTGWHKIAFASNGSQTAADGTRYNVENAVDASRTATIQGTFTQDGLMGGVRMFETIDPADKEKREPVLILITDGEPTRFIEDDDYSGNFSLDIRKDDGNWANETHCGYWTVRTAMYAKRTINEMYAAAGNTYGIMFDTIGPGVTSLYGKTVVNPSPEMLENCRLGIGAVQYENSRYSDDKVAAYNLYYDLMVDSQLKLNAGDIQYADFADYSLTGELTPEDVKDGMNQIIASIRQIPRPVITQGGATSHFNIIDTNSLVSFIDTLGENMELAGPPVISYGNETLTGTEKERGTLGSDEDYTSNYAGRPYILYRFEGILTEMSTGRPLDCSEILLYEIETEDGSTVMLWQIQAELLPIIYHNPGVNPASTDDDSFDASEPIRLHMTVQPKDGKAVPGETYYSNSTEHPTICTFIISEDNPYYNTVSGTQDAPKYTPRDRSATTEKAENTTGTLTNSSEYVQNGLKMDVELGNNGKLITPLSFEVMKIWADNNPDHIAEVTVHLLANGVDTGRSLTLSDSNDWYGTFSNLQKYDSNGNDIVYSVIEDVPSHYTVSGGEKTGMFSYEIETTTTQTVTVPRWESATSFVNGKTYRLRLSTQDGQVLCKAINSDELRVGDAASDTTTTREQWIYNDGYLTNAVTGYYLRIGGGNNTNFTVLRHQQLYDDADTTVRITTNSQTNSQYLRFRRGDTTRYLSLNGTTPTITAETSNAVRVYLEVLNPQHTEERTVETTETVSGYGFLLTNERIPLTIPVEKEWGPGTVPREITVQLYTSNNSGGYLERSTLTLNAANNWTAELDMTEYQDRIWYIREVDSLGYFVSYNGTTESLNFNGNTFKAMRVVPGETAKVTITNEYGAVLPVTGGIGTTIIYVIGALLMLGALTIDYILWRRREGRGVM